MFEPSRYFSGFAALQDGFWNSFEEINTQFFRNGRSTP